MAKKPKGEIEKAGDGLSVSRELAELFSTQDIAELKVIVLTSTDPSRKIEALRKIALSRLSEKEKAALYLRGLADEDLSVRAAAVKCLKQLGLNADVADTMKDLFEGTEEVKRRATERLAALVPEISDAEKGIVLLVLTNKLTDEAIPLPETLEVIRGLTDILSERPEQIESLARFMVARLVSDPGIVEPHFVHIYRCVAVKQRDVVWQCLQNELRKNCDVRVRGILLRVLWMTDPVGEEKEALLEETIGEAVMLDDSTPEVWDMAGCLVRGGEQAAVRLMEALKDASEEKKIVLSILLDRTCVLGDVSKKVKRAAAAHLLSVLKIAGRRLRNRIMECELAQDPDLTKKIRREFVQELVLSLQGSGETLKNAVNANIERMGAVAIEPLADMSRNARKPEDRSFALDILGRVVGVTDDPGQEKEVGGMIAMCTGFLDDDFEDKGTASVTLGRMCRSPLAGEEIVRESAQLLMAKLGSTSYPYQILEGLGFICASKKVSLDIAVEMADVLLGHFDEDLPDMKPSVTQDRDRDDVYAFGLEVSAYTVMVPLIMPAVERLSLNPATTHGLRRKILTSLLSKWEAVASWKEIWGPGNTVELVGTLERIGCSDKTNVECKLAILESLIVNISMPLAFQAMARISLSVPDSEKVDQASEAVVRGILEEYPDLDKVKNEEREILLPALGDLACRPRMAGSKGAERKLRQTVVDLLFDALKDNVRGVAERLKTIAGLPDLKESLRKEILQRIEAKGVSTS